METKQNYQVGEYYLTCNRSGTWCRTWYDSKAQQRKSASLRTRDFREAKDRLDDWFLQSRSPVLEEDLELSRCALEYWKQHAKFLKRHKAEKLNLRYWLEFFPEKMVREITPASQRNFIKNLVENGSSKGSIEGIFKTGTAAMNFAWENNMILSKVPTIKPSRELKKYKIKKKKRWRHLELKEVAAMIDNAGTDRLIRFILIMVGTACRPGAAVPLEGIQIDLKAGTIDLLDPDEEQSNKYRATVKLPSFIRSIYHPDNICSQAQKELNRDKPLDSIKSSWNTARRRGNLDSLVVPTSIRHTMAKWLREKGVQPWDTSAQLGHSRQGSEITEIYAPNDPAYLGQALAAIEGYYKELLAASDGLKRFNERNMK